MKKINRIGIIGQGFVGSAVNAGFKKHCQVETYDINGKCTQPDLKNLLLNIDDIIFLCLPTPMEKDGTCHLGIIEPVLKDLDLLCKDSGKIIVVKSTIPPGTTEKWNKIFKNIKIVFNPEFLTEANALDDFKNQSRIILGGPKRPVSKVMRLFAKAFPKVPIIKTGSTYAEMVKYVTNCFLANKVSFANEMYQICQGLDIDYDKVIEYAKHDERLGYSHWNVPGPDGDYGYGGHCFPKDVQALINVAMSLNIDPRILMSTHLKNEQVRQDRDWESQKGRAVI